MIKLYNPRPIEGQSFKGCKRLTVPRQSMSLREIVKRFIRRESLPVEKAGVYETRFGDLEKISKGDIYDQMEVADDLKQKIAAFEKGELERQKQYEADEAEKLKAKIIADHESAKPKPKPDESAGVR